MVVDGSTSTAHARVVGPEFFGGVRPLLGRLPLAEEHAAGGRAVAVLSHAFWNRQFDSSPAVIGRQIEVDGLSATIVGVAPGSFDPDGGGELWLSRGD